MTKRFIAKFKIAKRGIVRSGLCAAKFRATKFCCKKSCVLRREKFNAAFLKFCRAKSSGYEAGVRIWVFPKLSHGPPTYIFLKRAEF